MRIVLLGGTGHIGTWLVPRLVRAGHDVSVVSRGERAPYLDAPEWRAVRRITLDRDAADHDDTYGTRVAALDAEIVIDLICFEPRTARQLVDALRGRVALFLHCGTIWVHGVPKAVPYDETAKREPFGHYGIQKAEIERYLLDEARTGFPAAIMHPGHICGPGWAPINPAGNLDVGVFNTLARGETLLLPDDGLARLQHVHADDVAQAFALGVARPADAIGHAFHIAAREPVTLRDYAQEAATWFGRQARIEYLPWREWTATVSPRDAEITQDHVLHSPYASIDKARTRLGFEPRYRAVDAARDGVRWLEAEGMLSI